MTNIASFAFSRRAVNALYFVYPPLGLLFMYSSPSFTQRERRVRALVTAAFVALFAVAGPELQEQLRSQTALLSAMH